MIPLDLTSLMQHAQIGDLVCFFEMPVRPQPKERPRVHGGRGITPQRTRDYENAVATFAHAAMRGKAPTDRPVRVIIHAEQRDRRRADIDNVAKSLLDGISGQRGSKAHAGRVGPVLVDDSQVVELRVRLVRGASTDRVLVLVEEVSP